MEEDEEDYNDYDDYNDSIDPMMQGNDEPDVQMQN